MATTAGESLCAAANVFLGMVCDVTLWLSEKASSGVARTSGPPRQNMQMGPFLSFPNPSLPRAGKLVRKT